MEFKYKFDGQIIPRDGEVFLLTTSNVLGEKSDTIHRITMRNGVCVESILVKEGNFDHDWVGFTQEKLQAQLGEEPWDGLPSGWTEVVEPS